MMIAKAEPEGPVVQMNVQFRAPRPKVWRCWTEPDLLRKWFFVEEGWQTETCEVDLRLLGAYNLGMRPRAGGDETVFRGWFHLIEAERELTYAWSTCMVHVPKPYWTLVNVRFEDDGAGAKVALTHGVFANEQDRLSHEMGWTGCLTQLGKLADGA
jgi:uncharacterized protein YndB with AHSA1/START domain